MEDEVKRPLYVKCSDCGHRWIGLYLPMPIREAAKAMGRLTCPMCACSKILVKDDTVEMGLPQHSAVHLQQENRMTGEAMAEMPRYQCHKKVWALKISGIGPIDDNGCQELTFENKRYASIKVDYAYRERNRPAIGGYYVVYDDGYKSYSPAKAFEEGYTLIS